MNDSEPVPNTFRQMPTTHKRQQSSDSTNPQRSLSKNLTDLGLNKKLSKGKTPLKSFFEWHLTLGHRDINIVKSMEGEGKLAVVKDDWDKSNGCATCIEQRLLGR
jgi:hypothetical protein